jgi:hypothetical protein
MNDYLKTKLYRTTQKALSYYSDSWAFFVLIIN